MGGGEGREGGGERIKRKEAEKEQGTKNKSKENTHKSKTKTKISKTKFKDTYGSGKEGTVKTKSAEKRAT